jgi:O-acetyl-ADP-ribose deacetylase (regulator of RNase III)
VKAQIAGRTLELVQGDITRERVDAIVTAANSALAGGGGVDGAVHRAAGPALLAACAQIGGCRTGDAVATAPGELPVKRVIHAVGPIHGTHDGQEDSLLAGAHRRSLEVAVAEGCTSIAFPAISCGVYGFPIPRAARIAMEVIRDHLLGETPITRVRYVLFGEADFATFQAALRTLASEDERVTPGDRVLEAPPDRLGS